MIYIAVIIIGLLIAIVGLIGLYQELYKKMHDKINDRDSLM